MTMRSSGFAKRPHHSAMTIASASLLLLAFVCGAARAANKPVTWKPAEQALLRVDDHPVVDWNVYQDGKKTNPLLVQMNGRYLLVDGREQKVFEISPAKVERHGSDVSWDPSDRPDKPLATSDWVVRDVGLAYKITTKLVAEGKMLDVQLPHPLDVRSIH